MAPTLKGKKFAVVPILRAGLGLVEGVLRMVPSARVGHIGMYRNEETLEPVKYFCKMPKDIAERDILIVDPMLATGGSAAAAIGFTSMRRRSRSACLAVNNIPLTNADIITGVSMMLLLLLAVEAWNGPLRTLLGESLPKLNLGFWSLLIAHITFNVPYVILSVSPKLRQLDPNIYEAAQDLGDHGLHAFGKVILPEIMPGVVNGLLMAFTLSIDDFVISYFTAGAQTQTQSMVIYSMARKRVSPEINALSAIMFTVVVALMVIVNLRQASQERQAKRRQAALTAK